VFRSPAEISLIVAASAESRSSPGGRQHEQAQHHISELLDRLFT
jgi:hypothetical protein